MAQFRFRLNLTTLNLLRSGNLRKRYAGVALGLVALVFVVAIVSFLRENWSASQTPGAVERFLARWLLSRSLPAENLERNPIPPTPENLEAGRQLYEQQCAFCHGTEGRGQSPNGLQFYPPVPSLIDPQLDLSDGQMHFITSQGIRYTAMPSFAQVLSEEEIWQALLWVRQLAQPSQSPQAQPAESQPSSP